ncbi:hypothetical protein ACF0H5_001225 [Mactra antiquata]
MLTDCFTFRRYTCKRILIVMTGLTLSVSVFGYIFGTLVFTSLTPGFLIVRAHSLRNLTGDTNNLIPPPDLDWFSERRRSEDILRNESLTHEARNRVYFDDDEDIERNTRPNKNLNSTKTKCKKLPHAIIIGVKKGGTRALLEYLRLHPNVKAPGPEPHFFDKYYDKGLNWYRNAMPETKRHELTIEKTPSYFVIKGIPEKVYKMSKKTKLIIVFRDPVTRAISDYAQLVSRNPAAKTFEELVYINNRTHIIDTSWTIVKIGVYAQHLARWLEYFPLRQIHFVSGENLIKNPAVELKKIQEFLGLEQYITADNFAYNTVKGFPCYRRDVGSSKWHCLNDEKGRLHPDIDSSVKRHLEDFYRPFNLKLYSMTGQDFGWS